MLREEKKRLSASMDQLEADAKQNTVSVSVSFHSAIVRSSPASIAEHIGHRRQDPLCHMQGDHVVALSVRPLPGTLCRLKADSIS